MHKAALTTKFPSYIITPPQFVKVQELCPLDDLKAKDAAAAQTQTSPTLFIPNQPVSVKENLPNDYPKTFR
jgi:hypothetical protein